ncbi:hypothetical protein [Limosilactobacillus fastidiosus]|uniref:Uncharacterized protein n=1 Tax=Limosilactobacillus fastidiosus TaxID=2759855 RepID=A0A7W3TYP9_9LACO|nr:hypothetical protein [Limosilactobacillus fastidiosus]MBB1062998.1 hypothetical protein [Limosilactobacillus fastidiosus]MBB1085738.1 hypothetical protein [Limosilactobacillus fastidiosus]MCD7083920.1 hypothetical protein [Limosilactobacillus fastidiosus]MCD7086110.1 hypothetical protein [Limosilactobacillus fastidiosus]MCD7114618.1 hypothetical protein [Limosilactobacillus fastidiosus]
MASNSDSIYYVLTKIKHHPELVVGEKAQYINTISIFIKDSLKIADASFYFPDNRLMVNRLSYDFVAKNGDLLEGFFAKTHADKQNYHDVWATTSHVPQLRVYLLELSFE